MSLADDEIVIKIGNQHFTLRPTLRAGLRLYRKYDGFQKLSADIHAGSLSAASALIAATTTDPRSFTLVCVNTRDFVLADMVWNNREPLQRLILALSGVKPSDKPEAVTGEAITYDEYVSRLFGIATGWLGWSHDVAWNATASEILAGQRGRIELLKAVFGSKDDGETSVDMTSDKTDRAAIRAQLNALGDLSTNSMSAVA